MAKALVMDYEAACCIGTDFANARMRKAGRKAWSRDDFNAAAIKTAVMAFHGGIIGAKQLEELTGYATPEAANAALKAA